MILHDTHGFKFYVAIFYLSLVCIRHSLRGMLHLTLHTSRIILMVGDSTLALVVGDISSLLSCCDLSENTLMLHTLSNTKSSNFASFDATFFSAQWCQTVVQLSPDYYAQYKINFYYYYIPTPHELWSFCLSQS